MPSYKLTLRLIIYSKKSFAYNFKLITSKLPFSRFVVYEESMVPAYKPGDHVLTFNWVLPKVGDVVVFRISSRHPGVTTTTRSELVSRKFEIGSIMDSFALLQNDKNYLKRIKKITKNEIFVEGDNSKVSSKMAPVKKYQVVGKVILKY